MEVQERDRLLWVAKELVVVQEIMANEDEPWPEGAHEILRECFIFVASIPLSLSL